MPSLPPSLFDCVFYLYPSVEAATKGEACGGTGFFIGVPVGQSRFLVYAVTNWHVAIQAGCSVIRVNTKAAGVDIIDLDPSQWWFQPKGHDIAVAAIPLDQSKHAFQFIPIDMAASDTEIKSRAISAGEDVFMIGRFVDHDGAGTNVPSARFGNISVMPQPVLQPTGAMLPSYILDVHSRSGYSGSPVFAYRTVGADFNEPGLVIGGQRSRFILLLGIHWGQFPEEWEIKTRRQKPMMSAASVEANEKYIMGMSGMTLAVPITALLEILETTQFRNARETVKAQVARDFPTEPRAEVAQVDSEDANPSHKEDFTALLNAAVRKREPKR